MTEEHYYTADPTSAHGRHSFDATLRGIPFRFVTDASVFSKERVDFGSQTLIDTVSPADWPDGAVLDVGCGYGPIGLTIAALAPRRQVDMVDVNERALGLAVENAAANRIRNVHVFSSNVYAATPGRYAAIVTNPPIRAGKDVVNAILDGAREHLVEGGHILVVIQKKQGAPSAKKRLTAALGNCTVLKHNKGYQVLDSVLIR
ncbi:class I SAM-dependent methyltransferase [Schleiferilactobacillus shenzhenensis]|uniref:YbxB n=1 Tax=Schleiferilactobacillus shenzhenensis LY-73 TaxID=1231336 RepID=U4TS70_9LACO|nr:class I SAM-dependent methyltransferase [Schleiferilactobacillus shenzhenensis]ERL66295.1 YbxB [Schleiferilactobacillus shenzhenensis LY-73]